MKVEENRIYKQDCLGLLDSLINANKKVDAIITDPPYNISKPNGLKGYLGYKGGLDFGEWDKGFDQLNWLSKAAKVLKSGGCLFLFNDWKNLGDIARRAEEVGFKVKDLVRWRKNNPMPRNRDRRYITDYEMAIWLVKGQGKWTFNRLSDKFDRGEYCYPSTPRGEKVDGGHPTQKPLNLMKEIILRHTNEGDLILDPFMGSGSTLVAAKELKRKYIGSDMEEKYFLMASKRLGE